MKVYGIPTCGTYKKAISWFEKHNIDFEIIDLRVSPPSNQEIKKYHIQSGLEIKKFFNTSGKKYQELDMKNKQTMMTLEEIYDLLSKEPMLIKRPLVVDIEYVRTGFKEEEYIDQWLNK